jgi:hypothetical protein
MKNILTNLITSAVLLFTIGGGLQAQNIRMQAAVPFAWQVNGHQMNAGDYVITRDVTTQLLRIEGKTNKKGTFLIVVPDSAGSSTARLVFHCYGDRYFLAEVVAPDMSVGEAVVGAAEKAAMQTSGNQEVATVVVEATRATD